MNLNELDFIIEQLENLPNKKFDNQKIIYERQKRNKKQEDEDFLAELEAKAETDQQKDIGTYPKKWYFGRKNIYQNWPFLTINQLQYSCTTKNDYFKGSPESILFFIDRLKIN